MKKIYFLLVFFGALLFCACEKETADLLIEDQAQSQLEDSALKGAKKHFVPFRGEFEQEQTLFVEESPTEAYVELEGVGTVTHLGKTKLWVGQHWDSSNFPFLEGAAEVIFTAANGDELHADLYAYSTIELDDEWNLVYATVEGTGNFIGGTGRFSDASGTYDFTGDFNFLTGESNALYKGEIMY